MSGTDVSCCRESIRLLLILCIVAAGRLGSAQEEIRPDFVMLHDPEFDVPPQEVLLPEGAIRLWRDTLLRAEPELIKAAADSITLARREGFDGLDACVPELVEALSDPELHPDAAYAVARALIALNASDAADRLFSLCTGRGVTFRELIEPVLAEWDYAPSRDVWRRRLADASTRRRDLILACAGAGRVGDEEALPPLLEIVRAVARSSDVRLSAARAAGAIAATGLEAEAQTLLRGSSNNLTDALCAVSLIRRHRSQHAQDLLLGLAGHANPTVAEPALRALLEIDPQLVVPFAASALQNDDPKVRQCGLDTYIALPTAERIPLIADVMDDPHPDVRNSARRALQRFAGMTAFADAVRDAGLDVLNRPGWRGQEQAALLMAALNHRPAASRLVELLESDRPEVMVTTAWALRVLAVEETRDGLLANAQRVAQHVLKTPVQHRQRGSDHQLGHLFEALVVLRDERAIPLMRRMIPKDIHLEYSRSAAVWGLGKLLEDQPDDRLAQQLLGRILDVDSCPPELELVRQMSAVTIGRMNATSQMDGLRFLLGRQVIASKVPYALAWAVERMQGEVPPKAPPPTVVRSGWPIEPVPPSFAR